MVKRILHDRRRSSRLDIPLKIEQRLSRGGELLKALSSDISGNGLRFQLHRYLKKGEKLRTSIHFPSDPKPVTAVSEVIWCKEKPASGKKMFDAGIKYVKIIPRDRDRFIFLFCETMINYFMARASK
ncbi:MAG: PilZ domain-containing protein [Candidatus Omnitrophica bacterium]|nr:PilZ domain-containing protein [Candidatus Omnitrophota bacterium]